MDSYVFLVKNRWPLLIATLIFCVFSSFGLLRLGFDSSLAGMIADDNPYLAEYERLGEHFPRSNNLIFVIDVHEDSLYSRRHIESLRQLADGAAAMPFVYQVDSVLNHAHVQAHNDELIVGDLIGADAVLNEPFLRSLPDNIAADKLLLDRLIDRDGRITMVIANLGSDFRTDNKADIDSIIESAQQLKRDIQASNPGLKILLHGTAMSAATTTSISRSDATTLLPVVIFVGLTFTYIVTRSFAAIVTSILVVILSVMAGMGLAGWIGYKLNVTSSMASLLIMVLALADTLHLGTTFRKELQPGVSKLTAMQIGLEKNLRAIVLTSLTTMAGFYSLNFLGSRAFTDMGNIAIFGVAIACLLTLTVYPALAVMLTRQDADRGIPQVRLAAAVSDIAIRHHRLLFGAFLLLILITAPFITQNRFNDDFRTFFDKDTEIRQATDVLGDKLGISNEIEYSFESSAAAGINDPVFLANVEKLVQWYQSQPEVSHVYSYVDFIKRINQIMHNNDPAWYRLPDSAALAAQYLLLYELSADADELITHDRSQLRVLVSCGQLDNRQLIALEARAQRWMRENTPQIARQGVSADILFAHTGRLAVQNMAKGSVFTIMAITFVLVLGLRSLKFGLLSLLPNLVPAIVVYGLWGLFIRDMNLTVAVTYSVSLGLIIDDTVHVLTKYLAERRQGKHPELAIRNALENTIVALITTTGAIGSGLIAMSFATFRPNADIGTIMAPIIFIALLFDIFVLPGILLFVDRKAVKSQQRDAQAVSD